MMQVLLFALVFVFTPIAWSADQGAAPAAKSGGGWEALSNLQTGNMRFYEGHPSHPNLDPARRELVAGGQHPHTIIISCSDSRVPPEEIFDQGMAVLRRNAFGVKLNAMHV